MRLPRAICQSLIAASVFAILPASVLHAGAAEVASNKPAPPAMGAQHVILTPANLRFGQVAVGGRRIQTVAITNSGESDATLLQVVTTGKGFTVSGLDLPLTLARGESFTFSGVFAPQSTGDARGTISFVWDVSGPKSPIAMLGLTGRGTDIDRLTVQPATMNFGKVSLGSSAGQEGSLTAPDSQVTISSASISNRDFTLSGLSFPLTIPARGSRRYKVTFTPHAGGAVFATLSFFSGDQGSVTLQSLTGIGVASHGHSVDLSWKASTSEDVIGYNVYRGTRPGGPYRKINSVVGASTVYTDTSVTDGDTYYYVTTAVNSSHRESVYSNRARAKIP